VNTLQKKDFHAGVQLNIEELIAKAKELQAASKPPAANAPTAGKKAILPHLISLRNQLNVLENAVRDDIKANACKALNAGCFAADSKFRVPGGFKKVQDFVVGDEILARDEWDKNAPIETKTVEEVFQRFSGIAGLHAGGQYFRTTLEHPFFEHVKGWTACRDLRPGDQIYTEDRWITVEEVHDTGDWEVVYNVRVSDHHTYFVGDECWGWSVWAHNTYATPIHTHEGHSYPVEAISFEERLAYRTIVANSEYTVYRYKHILAKTNEQAKSMSDTGSRHAQYLACLATSKTNNGLELLALQKAISSSMAVEPTTPTCNSIGSSDTMKGLKRHGYVLRSQMVTRGLGTGIQ